MTVPWRGLVASAWEAALRDRAANGPNPDHSDELLNTFLRTGYFETAHGGWIDASIRGEDDGERLTLSLGIPRSIHGVDALLEALRPALADYLNAHATPDDGAFYFSCMEAASNAQHLLTAKRIGRLRQDGDWRRIVGLWCWDRLERDEQGNPIHGARIKAISLLREVAGDSDTIATEQDDAFFIKIIDEAEKQIVSYRKS